MNYNILFSFEFVVGIFGLLNLYVPSGLKFHAYFVSGSIASYLLCLMIPDFLAGSGALSGSFNLFFVQTFLTALAFSLGMRLFFNDHRLKFTRYQSLSMVSLFIFPLLGLTLQPFSIGGYGFIRFLAVTLVNSILIWIVYKIKCRMKVRNRLTVYSRAMFLNFLAVFSALAYLLSRFAGLTN